MTLIEKLREYIAAAFTGLWIQTHEHEDALAEIARLCKDNQWTLAHWDIDRGLQVPGGTADSEDPGNTISGSAAGDPLAAIRALGTLSSPAQPETSTLLVMSNLHRLLGSAEVVQALAHQLVQGKQQRTFIVVLAPVVNIPLELEKLFVVIEHDLPGREQLKQIAEGVATEAGELPEGDDLDRVLDAAAGLTRLEAEGAFALSLVREGKVEPEAIWELKTQTLKKSGLLNLHRGHERFADLGGLTALKQFCLKALNRASDATVRARGLLLLGIPGSGKSAFAKALGRETGRPTLTLDIGALMGSLVGQTEGNLRRALATLDAMSPCIAFADEIEKALAGTASSGQTDSGVSARLFGSLLTWLNDHTSDVFFIATCNDISKLPPEFSRSERFDGIFFLDLPGREQKDAIWHLYQTMFELSEHERPEDTNWTGAEIKACCRLARLLDMPLHEAAEHVVPVAVTAHENVQQLRSWAAGRCLDAEQSGIYQVQRTQRSASTKRSSRRVARPSDN
ncbi:AAA family ATPase [Phycisphaerales bacterium AB-hyl4]|uniref:Uncharacterized AAA domain-containing protein ycf46 n=1 Tax=Natronomicrosphaera hydrolytica TaxID=3242702 RepID=A0ABV4U8A1_9BACT